jgi:hypothetical protein
MEIPGIVASLRYLLRRPIHQLDQAQGPPPSSAISVGLEGVADDIAIHRSQLQLIGILSRMVEGLIKSLGDHVSHQPEGGSDFRSSALGLKVADLRVLPSAGASRGSPPELTVAFIGDIPSESLPEDSTIGQTVPGQVGELTSPEAVTSLKGRNAALFLNGSGDLVLSPANSGGSVSVGQEFAGGVKVSLSYMREVFSPDLTLSNDDSKLNIASTDRGELWGLAVNLDSVTGYLAHQTSGEKAVDMHRLRFQDGVDQTVAMGSRDVIGIAIGELHESKDNGGGEGFESGEGHIIFSWRPPHPGDSSKNLGIGGKPLNADVTVFLPPGEAWGSLQWHRMNFPTEEEAAGRLDSPTVPSGDIRPLDGDQQNLSQQSGPMGIDLVALRARFESTLRDPVDDYTLQPGTLISYAIPGGTRALTDVKKPAEEGSSSERDGTVGSSKVSAGVSYEKANLYVDPTTALAAAQSHGFDRSRPVSKGDQELDKRFQVKREALEKKLKTIQVLISSSDSLRKHFALMVADDGVEKVIDAK